MPEPEPSGDGEPATGANVSSLLPSCEANAGSAAVAPRQTAASRKSRAFLITTSWVWERVRDRTLSPARAGSRRGKPHSPARAALTARLDRDDLGDVVDADAGLLGRLDDLLDRLGGEHAE